jgi:hypothetical protein
VKQWLVSAKEISDAEKVVDWTPVTLYVARALQNFLSRWFWFQSLLKSGFAVCSFLVGLRFRRSNWAKPYFYFTKERQWQQAP